MFPQYVKKLVRINLHKLDLKNARSMKLSLELLKKLDDKINYDSDKTEDYWPMEEDHSSKFRAVLVNLQMLRILRHH